MLNLLRKTVRARTRRATPAACNCNADLDALLAVARASFVQVQAAWDAADLTTLATFTTEPLLADLRCQLQARGPGPNCTEVLSLHAELLALEEMQEAYVASVEFSGLIRERLGSAAAPFRELWLLANAKGNAHHALQKGWRLAGVQSLI